MLGQGLDGGFGRVVGRVARRVGDPLLGARDDDGGGGGGGEGAQRGQESGDAVHGAEVVRCHDLGWRNHPHFNQLYVVEKFGSGYSPSLSY